MCTVTNCQESQFFLGLCYQFYQGDKFWYANLTIFLNAYIPPVLDLNSQVVFPYRKYWRVILPLPNVKVSSKTSLSRITAETTFSLEKLAEIKQYYVWIKSV